MASPEETEDFADLFVDRNLLDVFKEEPTIFANSFNRYATLIVFVLLTSFAAVRFHHRDYLPPPSFVATFSLWANVGWTVAATLLGFLIAGFALLCTVLRPSAVVALHQYREDPNERNLLRQMFVSFVGLFITYLALLVFSLAVVITTSPNGPFIELKQLSLYLGPEAPLILGYSIMVLWGTWFVVAALKLKSFIFNLYQSLMIGMAESAHSVVECANMVTEQSMISGSGTADPKKPLD